MSVTYYSGLDLGQTQDHSALVVIERSEEGVLAVRHIHRWPLGTSYPQIADDLKALFAAPPLQGSTLVIDHTGVGVAVVDLIRALGLRAWVVPYTITAGLNPGEGTVPKKDLVAAVQVGLGTKTLKFAEGLELGPVLAAELEAFRAKVTPDRNETFASWRERDHDDLVLALALAVYEGRRPRLGGPTFLNRPPLPSPLLGGGTDWATPRGLYGLGR